jgi:hypothetical protein
MFEYGTVPISDGLGRFLVRARTGMIYAPQRKAQIYHQWDGNYNIYYKVGNLKHFLNCFMNKDIRMTQRRVNVG